MISQRIVEAMGGRIWVESEPGLGSTFHFTVVLPRAAHQPPAVTVAAPPAAAAGPILLIDDNLVEQRLVTEMLEHQRTPVIAVSTAADATDAAAQASLIVARARSLADRTAVEGLRRHTSAGRTPVIWITMQPSLTHADDEVSLRQPIQRHRLARTLAETPTRGNTVGGSVLADAAASASLDADTQSPLRILLAEDNPVNQRVALLMLRKLRYEADVAADGREALAALARSRYDVLLLDLQMPDIDGYEVAKQLRDRVAASDRPWIIALTANAMPEDRQACEALGMDDFVAKPVQVGTLGAALERARAGRDLRRAPEEPARKAG